MKKYIPLLIITSLLLSACSFNGSNKEDSFQKKIECAKIDQEMLKKRLDTTGNFWLIPGNGANDKGHAFYSKKHDSCLFDAVNTSSAGKYENCPNGTTFLFDYNNNKNLSNDMPTDCNVFYKEIEKLKGE